MKAVPVRRCWCRRRTVAPTTKTERAAAFLLREQRKGEKMKINEKLYKSLISCNWFQNSGSTDNTSYNFDRQIIMDKEQLFKNIQSMSWENVCLDAKEI